MMIWFGIPDLDKHIFKSRNNWLFHIIDSGYNRRQIKDTKGIQFEISKVLQ